MRIAIVEDDPDQAALLQAWLVEDGFDCHIFENGVLAIKALQKDSYDLVLLDWHLPQMTGTEVLEWLRQNLDWEIPVIFVTQRDSEEDLAYVLEKGADDYIAKPITPTVLLARIHALLRRVRGSETEAEKPQTFGKYCFDTSAKQLFVDRQPVALTQKEFELALFLFRNTGRLMSRSYLLENVWGHSAELNTRTLDTHMSRLRKKLQLGEGSGWRLNSVYHQGYRLEHVVAH